MKIGAPIAAGLVAGPAGSAAYAAYDHRHWIKRHVLHSGHHHDHHSDAAPRPPRKRA